MSAPVSTPVSAPPSTPAGANDEVVETVVRVRSRAARRGTLTAAALGVAIVVAFCLSLSLGEYPIPVGRVIPLVFGQGAYGDVLVVQDLRLPRAVLGILVGLGLGMSGAVFQSLVRNPLASPDILGITAGGSMFAVFGITVVGASGVLLSGYATVGALVTALVIYFLGYRRGLSSYRLVLVGIGVGAVATALMQFLWATALYQDAASIALWISGSLNGRGWENIIPTFVLLLVFVPAALLLRRPLNALELGDDSAAAIGVRVQRSRGLLLLAAVGLAGAAVGGAGPVAFVAFVSAPIARRLARSPGPALVASGLFGALLVLTSDLVGRLLLPNTEIPVGVITGIVGAPYLLWLLVRTNRAGQGD